jgi:glycosyltransferase involved in cell wall biosynthesis
MAYLAEAMVVRELCSAHRIEHVHVHFGTNPTTVAMLCRIMGGPPYSFTAHGPEEFERPGELAIAEKAAHASCVVCVTEHGLERMRDICGSDRTARIILCRSGVSELFLRAPPFPAPAEPVLVFVGRLAEQKQPVPLLRSFARCVERVPGARLRMIGDGPLRGHVEQAVLSLGLGASVTIHGWRDEAAVLAAMQSSRAVVLASCAEGLPAVVMEAGAAGRPSIATDVGGVGELVRDGDTGWLVRPGDEEALANAMTECLLATLEDIERRGAAARLLVLARHDVREQTRRLVMGWQARPAELC